MPRWFRNSLVVKIMLPTVLLVLLVSAASAAVIGRLIREVHEDAGEARAQRFSAVVSGALARQTERGHAGVQPLLELLCASTDRGALVTAPEGRVVFACRPELRGTTVAVDLGDSDLTQPDGTRWKRHVRPVENAVACAGCHQGDRTIGFVAVDVPMEESAAEVKQQQGMTLVAGAVTAIVVALLLGLVQLLVIFRPLRQLVATVERLRSQDLTARVRWSRRDEIGHLGQSLDDMAASIERAEAELGRTHRAELAQSEKLAALGQLLTSVAHEIRNQLTGVIGALKVVEAESPTGDPNKPVLGRILSQMERMSQTVVTAMEFARPLRPAVVSVDVAEVLDRASFFVEREAVEHNIRLQKRYAPALPHAHIDEDLMKQVFLNIMLNGVQAMPRGGTLDVETRAAGARAIEVTISDQGVGIPAEHLARIFSPFFSTKTHGTGLGLYIARQIVETQRGQIEVQSRPGEGTSFTVRLPAAVGPGEAL